MRLLHTADWHLGQTLHGVPREHEHQRFLDWLLDRIAEHRVDALVVAGDVFDTQNPPISALARFYRFLARAAARFPDLDVVVVAGNHDSASRLEAPAPLLDAMGVRVVGSLPWDAYGAFDPDRLVVPLRDRTGEVAARLAAVPFLRPADLPIVEEDGQDPLVEGVRRVYAEAAGAARRQGRPGEALVLTGHCYMAGGALSELSERKILGGNLHALPCELFPEDAAYVALGHLHRAQSVGGRAEVRYSGSPLPLAIDEDSYAHQVVLAELAEGRMVEVEGLRVPRTVGILRLPGGGTFAPVDAVLEQLRALPLDPALPRDEWPYLEVSVELDAPRPGLREEVEALVEGRPVRLLKLGVRLTGTGETLAETAAGVELSDLSPEDVFRRAWARRHAAEPGPDLLAAFATLLERVEREGP